uniref:NADH-ubiquinone oxidoreductase chain 2 n=1 Tax=Lophiomus setigerus TaxID=292417 RepID=Q8HM78_LOPSE|nr:NADH dehydrogenase subunit 2 [Lophiomus setigerus]BAC23282.1 NADH dehydrogenase subunit 2 [Lophiomus setigerus]
MNPTTLFILMSGLALGTTATFASSHWFLAWMGLELNTLAIIPLMSQHHHPRAVEAATKYFLTQATAAAVLLFATVTNAWLTGQWDIQQMTHPLPSTMIVMALALKMGLAPLHTWLPEVLQGIDLTTALLLSTWQKLAPFILLLQIQQPHPTILVTLGLLSVVVGGWGGLNQTQLRKILAYSSIAHLGWLIIIMPYSPSLSLLTLALYFVLTFSTFITFKLSNSLNINSLAASWTKLPLLAALIPLIMLSLGGLPPLTGFMPKWLILSELTKQGMSLTATLIALSALLSLYFYLRLSYAVALTIPPANMFSSTPWRLYTNQLKMPLAVSISIATLLLPLAPTTAALLQL